MGFMNGIYRSIVGNTAKTVSKDAIETGKKNVEEKKYLGKEFKSIHDTMNKVLDNTDVDRGSQLLYQVLRSTLTNTISLAPLPGASIIGNTVGIVADRLFQDYVPTGEALNNENLVLTKNLLKFINTNLELTLNQFSTKGTQKTIRKNFDTLLKELNKKIDSSKLAADVKSECKKNLQTFKDEFSEKMLKKYGDETSLMMGESNSSSSRPNSPKGIAELSASEKHQLGIDNDSSRTSSPLHWK